MTASAIVLVILSVAVIAALLYPLIVSAARDRRVSRGPSELDALLRRKAVLYANMKDLEFEHQMGKLSEADFDRLRSEDRVEAARLLQEIDALEDADDADAMIEREIAARQFGARDEERESLEEASGILGRPPVAPRYSLGGGRPKTPDASSLEVREEPSVSAEASAVFCGACGARSRTGDRFCWRCGAALYAGESE